MKKICIVTGSRAEYYLLLPLMKEIQKDNELDLLLAVTGSHLSERYGNTYQDIEKDGFKINRKVPILQDSDEPDDICIAMGRAIVGFSKYFQECKPDMVILLGDRYEVLSVAIAAMNHQVPIAHLHGGETTEGAVDECIRHAVSKISYLHFTSCEAYRKRVIQLGESPGRVFNVGAIGLENIRNLPDMPLEELGGSLRFALETPFAVVTFHPVTLEKNTAGEEFQQLLHALNCFEQLKVIFTKSNADHGGLWINQMIDGYVAEHPGRCKAVYSLGMVRYLTALKFASVVIGNSSSGIIETPSFGTPTVNIGDRQRGRIQAKNIINCSPVKNEIVEAIRQALSDEFRGYVKDTVNPYGDGKVASKILFQIKKFLQPEKIDLKKTFYSDAG